ncbi:hypothetical protein DFJ73DRAFT_882721 [Zopfochytrium polystomum]|nr:hypothetical protein DFJ73DRAFT_882721 [Zopfochytrium polystomum]
MSATVSSGHPRRSRPRMNYKVPPLEDEDDSDYLLSAPSTSKSSKAKSSKASSSSSQAVVSAGEEEEEEEITADEEVTRCVCDQKESFGVMIQCEKCLVWQHCSCVGVPERKLPKHYYCEKCNRDHYLWKTRRPSDSAVAASGQTLSKGANKKRSTMNSREASQNYSDLLPLLSASRNGQPKIPATTSTPSTNVPNATGSARNPSTSTASSSSAKRKRPRSSNNGRQQDRPSPDVTASSQVETAQTNRAEIAAGGKRKRSESAGDASEDVGGTIPDPLVTEESSDSKRRKALSSADSIKKEEAELPLSKETSESADPGSESPCPSSAVDPSAPPEKLAREELEMKEEAVTETKEREECDRKAKRSKHRRPDNRTSKRTQLQQPRTRVARSSSPSDSSSSAGGHDRSSRSTPPLKPRGVSQRMTIHDIRKRVKQLQEFVMRLHQVTECDSLVSTIAPRNGTVGGSKPLPIAEFSEKAAIAAQPQTSATAPPPAPSFDVNGVLPTPPASSSPSPPFSSTGPVCALSQTSPAGHHITVLDRYTKPAPTSPDQHGREDSGSLRVSSPSTAQLRNEYSQSNNTGVERPCLDVAEANTSGYLLPAPNGGPSVLSSELACSTRTSAIQKRGPESSQEILARLERKMAEFFERFGNDSVGTSSGATGED